MTQFQMVRDVSGLNSFLRPPADTKYSCTLPTSSAVTLTIPLSFSKGADVIFSYEAGSNVWVAINQTAAGPAGNTFASTTSARNPIGFQLKGGDVISIYTSDVGIDMGVEIYAV
jgi:hypothetical protein